MLDPDLLDLNLSFFPLLCFRLDVYIHDYFVKRKLHNAAKAFMTEGKVSTDPVGKIAGQSLLCCIVAFLTTMVVN